MRFQKNPPRQYYNKMATSTEVDGRLWLLQERLKQEHLFVTKEKESIRHMSTEIQSTFEKLFHLSWIAGQQWRNLQRLQAHPAKASYANSLLDNAQFVDAYKGFGHFESKYGEFLRGLRERPQLLASCLAFVDSIKINMDIRQVVRLVLNSLYGNCLLPEDENYVLMLMKSLMECQVLESEQPLTFFRSPKNWSFTVMFGVLIESLFSAKLYLTAALHTQILQVLAKDSLIQAQLPFLCTRFVHNLEEKLYCFPPSLRWLVCQLFNVLRSSVISEKQAKSMVSELIFNYLICPAIINPEPYGINSDMQVSKTARLNLQQISSLLCKSCTTPWQDEHVFQTADMFNSIDVKSISSFVDSILDGAHQMNNFPDQQTLPGLCRTSVLITENELKALIAFMKMVCSWEGDVEFTEQKQLQELLDLLPEQIETPPKQIQAPSIPTPSPSASPKVPQKSRKLPWKKHGKHLSDAPSLDDDEEQTLKKTTITLLASVTPTVSKAQKYQQECIKRLGELFQENEDVLVVSLGYSSVESPGMLSEDKILGIEKPKIKQAKKPRNNSDGTQPFRARTSSNKFTKLFHEMSIEKDLNKNGSSSSENEVETSGDHRLDTIVGSPSVSKVEEAEEVAIMIKMHEQQKVDLVQGTTVASLNPFKNDGPDVVESGAQNSEGGNQPAMDLLIDFSSEPANFSSVTSSSNANHHTGSLLDAPLSCDRLPHFPGLPEFTPSTSTDSPRDSTISSGSSARDSTFSNWSGLSSGRDSTVDSGFVEIREEDDDQFNRYSHGTNPFNRYSHGDTSTDDRRSVISTVSRDSYSSGTLIEGAEGFYRSNRDSQVSTWSEDYHGDVQRSGSSSTQEDDLDLRDQPKSKKISKASIKKKIEKKAQSLNFNDRKKNKEREKRRKSLLESDSSGKNEKKGFMKRWRDKGQKKRSKQSGARVYQPINDNTMSMFGVLPTIPFVQVEAADEKTPKDIMDKYIKVAAMKQAEDFSEGKGEEEDSEEDDDDVLDEADRLEDTKRKLRIVFTQADFRNLPWLVSKDRVINTSSPLEGDGGELMTFLHVQLAEAINLQNRSLAAQLHETIRSVKQLSQGSCSNILSIMEKEYQERMPYVAYLTRSRQALLTTQCHVERLIERVQKNEMICKKCFSTNCITLFLEEREREINSFINGFRSTDVCPTVDEKSKYLEQFLEKMYAELEKDDAWLGTTEEQFEEGCIAIERDIMARVYNDAFYPNGEADMERDKAFTKHVERLQGIVGVNHRAIRIPKMYRKEAPWPSAQQELKTINAYKTPKDKLKCVQRCCFTIMNLLNMASASNSCDPAGADEFVPALVCVLIQANPPSLLSTMQYVSNFYEQRLLGEEAWSWMQLCAAIEYTKTIQG